MQNARETDVTEWPTWEFTLLLDRAPTDDEWNAIHEAGLDDASLESGDDRHAYMVDRVGPTLLGSIAEAVGQIRSVGGPEVIGLETDLPDLVALNNVSARLNGSRSTESLRLLSLGKRGPGGFPKPVSVLAHLKLYSFAEVTTWLREVMGDDIPPVWPDLALADQALRLAAWARRTDHIAEVQRLVA
jgi:hypothetical protein